MAVSTYTGRWSISRIRERERDMMGCRNELIFNVSGCPEYVRSTKIRSWSWGG
jgi:hypothetical protein